MNELQDNEQNQLVNNYINKLNQKIKNFEIENSALKETLKQQNNNITSLKKEKIRIYESLKKHQAAFAETIMQKDSDILSLEKELTNYIEEKSHLQEQVDKLKLKSKRYDELQGNLLRIQLKAESTALKMIEESQTQSMEAISIIDDISKEVYLFMIDIDKLKEDLKIGTATIEDRISSICYKFNFYLQNLKKIKKSFYESNNLTIPNEE